MLPYSIPANLEIVDQHYCLKQQYLNAEDQSCQQKGQSQDPSQKDLEEMWTPYLEDLKIQIIK